MEFMRGIRQRWSDARCDGRFSDLTQSAAATLELAATGREHVGSIKDHQLRVFHCGKWNDDCARCSSFQAHRERLHGAPPVGHGAYQRGSANVGTCFLAAALAALMLLAGPLLDQAADADLQATDLADAQAQARHEADYARWVRRACRHDAASWMQLEHGTLVCYDSAGQRVDGAVVAQRGTP